MQLYERVYITTTGRIPTIRIVGRIVQTYTDLNKLKYIMKNEIFLILET